MTVSGDLVLIDYTINHAQASWWGRCVDYDLSHKFFPSERCVWEKWIYKRGTTNKLRQQTMWTHYWTWRGRYSYGENSFSGWKDTILLTSHIVTASRDFGTYCLYAKPCIGVQGTRCLTFGLSHYLGHVARKPVFGCLKKLVSNQSPQLQRLARKL